MAANVPKFASFRPKPEAPAEPKQGPDRPHRDRISRESGASRNRDGNKQTSSTKSSNSTVHGKEDRQVLYFQDRKGDPANLTYGTLNQYHTPAYRRYGFGSVLGLSPSMRIDRDWSSDKGLFVSDRTSQRQEGLLSTRYAAQDGRRVLRFVKSRVPTSGEENLDYIQVSNTAKRKRGVHSDAEEVDYRTLSHDEQAESDAEDDSGTELQEWISEVTQKNSELARKTRERPHDVDAWQNLINHQEAMMTVGQNPTSLSNSDKRRLADVRIPTYEEALRKIGENRESQIKLYLGLVSEAHNTWSEAKVSAMWTTVLNKFPHSLEIWTKYLDYVQGNFSNFKYESCRESFRRCCAALQASADMVSPESYLYLVVRWTSMIQEAGYQELALAIWQALLEFHLLRPKTLDRQNSDDTIPMFEEFWDSEVPRIGEENARGWLQWDADASSQQPGDNSPIKITDLIDHNFENFGVHELDHITKLRLPGRTTDITGEDDPFHLILFSDIEEFLRIPLANISALPLLQAFLCFCHLPPFPRIRSNEDVQCLDPLLRQNFIELRACESGFMSFSQNLDKFSNTPGNFQLTVEVLFDRGFPPTETADLNVVRRVLLLLALDTGELETIGEYLLAFELKYFPSDVFKTAKRLLKARPSSFVLYNAYGLVESRRGKPDKADQIFSTALSMQKDAAPLTASGSLALFNNWVSEALRRGDLRQALRRLTAPTAKVPRSEDNWTAELDQTAILRARTLLSEGYERSLLSHDYVSAVLCVSLSALLAYLLGDNKPEIALSVHDGMSNWLRDHDLLQSPAAELHAQTIAQFLVIHATKASIVKPSLLRTVLEPLIHRFPNNTILLSLYAANEARFSIDDRVRGLVHRNIIGSSMGSNITTWFFAIHYEMQKSEISGATSHSVRAIFKRAEEGVGAYCPAIWKTHVLFELQEAAKERKRRPPNKSRRGSKKSIEEARLEEAYRRVKETFFQGMTHLPWCKDYMMLAFTHLQESVLSDEELKKVYNVMVEKELRIYVDIEASPL